MERYNLPAHWLGRPYYSLDAWFKQEYGCKIYKIALDAGFTCPNRDGRLDSRGCIFCSVGGSGEFAARGSSIDVQLKQGLSLFGEKKTGSRFLAYFQAYTNTYGPLDYLENIYSEALSHPDIMGISIATRPDCLSLEILELLTSLKARYAPKVIWVELGLQTIHEDTACYIRRGYPLSVFTSAMTDLVNHDIPVIVHLILGLPGENEDRILQTVDYINSLSPFGVKLQLLHILKGTDLAKEYEAGKIEVFSKEAYVTLLSKCLTYLSQDIVIHRLTGDGPKDLTLAPYWSLHKREVLNSLHKYLKENHLFQGKLFVEDHSLF
ncbi:MAG: TIGR01212 family radical SAM protein [Lachnospiraceae bacterium]|nr:TIGR01212 family radical SAM protein [Lachnospiraceae bacterium]